MKKVIRGLIAEIELKTLLVSLLFIISLFVFGYLAHEIVGENETGFDEKAFHFFAGFSSQDLLRSTGYLLFLGLRIFPSAHTSFC